MFLKIFNTWSFDPLFDFLYELSSHFYRVMTKKQANQTMGQKKQKN